MKLKPISLLLPAIPFLTLSSAVEGATYQIGNATYTTDTALVTVVGTVDQYLLESSSATWTIGFGVTVSGGRFFIGSTADPDTSTATFTIDGGGTLDITRTGTFNLRLGQNGSTAGIPNSEAGVLVIRGGSTLRLSGTTAGAFQEQTGSLITLDGLGSTFTSVGTYDATTGRFTSQSTGTAGVLDNGQIPINALGGTIQASTNGAYTTLTVVPEPSIAFLGGLGLLGLLRRRRA